MARRFKRSIVCASLLVWSISSNANWMDDFYAEAGGGGNTTAAQVIHTQQALGYSAGGMSWRTPNRAIQPFSISAPSLKAGCGGIDAWLGSFTMINKDQFVQALRNIGQAAIGYFFELSIRTMAPEVAATLDVLNDLAQRANGLGKNSCEMAQMLIKNSGAEKWMEDNKREATGYVRSVGQAADEFAANLGWQDSGFAAVIDKSYEKSYGKPKANVTSDDVGKVPPVEVNVVYWLLKNSNQDITEDERLRVMSLIGPSWVWKIDDPNSPDAVPQGQGKPSTLDFRTLVGDVSSNVPSSMVWACGSSDAECLDLTPDASGQSVPSFTNAAYTLIDKMKVSIQNGTPVVVSSLTPTELIILRMANVPLYRAAALAASSGEAALLVDSMKGDLAYLAAISAAYNYMQSNFKIMHKALTASGPKLKGPAADAPKAIEQRMADLQANMAQYIQIAYSSNRNPFETIRQLEYLEAKMHSRLNATLSANAQFGVTTPR